MRRPINLSRCPACVFLTGSGRKLQRKCKGLKLWKWTREKWITCLLLVLSAVGIGLLSLCFAITQNRWDMMECYFKRPLLLLLNLLPGVLLCLFLWFLCNRAVIAYGVTAVVIFGLSLANWYKLQFRNDPLMFGDLLLV